MLFPRIFAITLYVLGPSSIRNKDYECMVEIDPGNFLLQLKKVYCGKAVGIGREF